MMIGGSTVPVGDAAILLVRLDDDRPRPALLEALLRMVESDSLALLDFAVITRRTARECTLTEVDAGDFALAGLALGAVGLIGMDDAAVLAGRVRIGGSAAIILVEERADLSSAIDFEPLRRHVIDVRPVGASAVNAVLQSTPHHVRSATSRRRPRSCRSTRDSATAARAR